MMRAMIEAHHPGGSVKLDKTYNEEMLKCNKNPECNVSGYHQEGAGHAELAAVRLAVAKTTALGHLLVIKEQGSHNPATRVAMHEMGAYPVVGYRSNVLARMCADRLRLQPSQHEQQGSSRVDPSQCGPSNPQHSTRGGAPRIISCCAFASGQAVRGKGLLRA